MLLLGEGIDVEPVLVVLHDGEIRTTRREIKVRCLSRAAGPAGRPPVDVSYGEGQTADVYRENRRSVGFGCFRVPPARRPPKEAQ
jgi:hypothetical protein